VIYHAYPYVRSESYLGWHWSWSRPDSTRERVADMGEAADRERPPWRCTVAVQAALCLALYAAFSLGEPQLIPRGGVDALGRGARGGGVAFLSVAGGARGPIDQERLLRQVRAFRTHPPTSTPYRSGISSASQFTRAFRRLVLLSSWSGVLHLVSPVCDLALSPSPLLRDAQDFLRGALVDLTSSPLRVGNWHGRLCGCSSHTRETWSRSPR
jgi:hypothetical protein